MVTKQIKRPPASQPNVFIIEPTGSQVSNALSTVHLIENTKIVLFTTCLSASSLQ